MHTTTRRGHSDYAHIARTIGTLTILIGLARFASSAPVPWRDGPAELQAKTPADIQTLLESVSAERSAEPHRFVVQFESPVDDALRAAVAAQGLHLLDYIGANAFFAALLPGQANAELLSQFPGLVAADSIHPEWKQHPLLNSGATVPWSVVATGSDGVPIVGVYVLFHSDADLASGAALVSAYAGVVRDRLESINGLVIELPRDLIPLLAAEDTVQWIEPPLPPLSVVNDSNRALTQANTVQAAPYGLTGAGIKVMVYDGGTGRATHVDFQGRLSVRDSSGTADHSTHVAGTIGGAGIANATYKGMAPGVTIESYGFEYDGSGTFLYDNPGDLESDYSNAISVRGAVISNNSIGTNVETNGFDCDIQGDYGVTDRLIDVVVRGDGSNPLFASPFRVIWANGNERQGSSCDIEGYGDYYSTAPPACAKNHITVGAVNSNDDSMTTFSSWGPVDDGRLKPDISAPGCQSSGDSGVTSCSSSGDSAYATKCGTSMASPTVCGLAALLLQDFKAQFPGQALPRNSTLKAWFAHTAVDRGNTGPDYQFGYGSVRIQNAIDFMRSGAFTENTLSQGSSYTRTVVVGSGDPELKVTLAWDDAPGTPNVSPALVNDLDLRVYDPNGARYYPWTLNPTSPSTAAVRTQEDHTNNIEQVQVANPGAGTWTIQVYGYNVPQGPQPFSLVGDGAANISTTISFPSGLPATMTPGTPTTIDVQVASVGETTVPGSPTMYYRYQGGAYQPVALTLVSGNLYQGTLPAAACGDTPQFYFSAAGSSTGVVYSPTNAPTGVYSALVGENATLFADDFQTDQGWVATNLGATSGDWQRGVPVNDSSWAYDPAADSDGSGMCWLTQNTTGNTDIDNGAVQLKSPVIDMAGATNLTISYDYYLYLTNTSGAVDRLLVEISSNGDSGPWIEIARHVTNGGLSWRHHMIDQAALTTAGVTLTANMKLRFTANDADTQSIVEAGLDAFQVQAFQCVGPPSGACCQTDGSCAVTVEAACTGTWQGASTTCSPNPCPQPTGACCQTDGSCSVTTAAACTGTWQGASTTCSPNPCPQTGCAADANCDGAITWRDIDYFVAAQNDSESAWWVKFAPGTPSCPFSNCDVNGDSHVTWRDINPFVGLMNTTCP